MTRQEGLEPPTNSLEGCRSIHLSYWRLLCRRSPSRDPNLDPRRIRHIYYILPRDRGGRIRTGDLLLPKQARYRATLRPADQRPRMLSLVCAEVNGNPQIRYNFLHGAHVRATRADRTYTVPVKAADANSPTP